MNKSLMAAAALFGLRPFRAAFTACMAARRYPARQIISTSNGWRRPDARGLGDGMGR
jgi:hypothetical protein